MRAVARFVTALAQRLEPLGLCGTSGLLSGLLAGFILMLESGAHEDGDPTLLEGLAVAGMLTLFAWLVLMFVLTILARLTFASVALPAFVNALLVVFITVAIALGLDVAKWAVLIGAVVGALVGALLCRLDAARKGGRR